MLFYVELKNAISRVAFIKQLLGDTSWRVTPRSATAPIKEPDQTMSSTADDGDYLFDETAALDEVTATTSGASAVSFSFDEDEEGLRKAGHKYVHEVWC